MDTFVIKKYERMRERKIDSVISVAIKQKKKNILLLNIPHSARRLNEEINYRIVEISRSLLHTQN